MAVARRSVRVSAKQGWSAPTITAVKLTNTELERIRAAPIPAVELREVYLRHLARTST